jgi:hypothetical protein
MLLGIVQTICDRPDDTPEQRDARSREVVEAVQGLAPRDPVELMLAGLAVLHAYLIQDAAGDLLRERDDRLRSRTKSQIAAFDRGMFGFLRELRVARKRPLGADEPRQEQAAELVASLEALANGVEPHQVPEPEIAACSPPPSFSPDPPAAVPGPSSVTPSVAAKPLVVDASQTRPLGRLPLTAKAKRQQIKALKILARRAAVAARSQPGHVAPPAATAE